MQWHWQSACVLWEQNWQSTEAGRVNVQAAAAAAAAAALTFVWLSQKLR
jgi:hypothetical protein